MNAHPRLKTATRKLRDIRRLVRSASKADVTSYRRQFAEALTKHPDGRQAVYFIEDLIEQNQPLRW